MVKAHTEYLNLHIFLNEIRNTDESDGHLLRDHNLKELFLDLYRIAGLRSLINNCGDLYSTSYLAPTAIRNMKIVLDDTILRLRPHLIGLVEGVNNMEVPSSVGNKSGILYERTRPFFSYTETAPREDLKHKDSSSSTSSDHGDAP